MAGKKQAKVQQRGKRPRLDVKRAYAPAAASDGYRVLVDRVWPRGIGKDRLRVKEWLKEVGPSTELRKWFGHDPARWAEFQRRYWAELDAAPATWHQLLRTLAKGKVTLVFGARDEQHNNAVALRQYLLRRLEEGPLAGSGGGGESEEEEEREEEEEEEEGEEEREE